MHSTYKVPMSLHRKNRDRLVDSLRKLPSQPKGTIVLQGGVSETRHDTDHEPLFRQESFFAWATGVKEPDFFCLIDIESGKTTLLAPRLPQEYAVWMGKIYSPSHFQDLYQVDSCQYVDEIVEVLSKSQTKTIFTLKGLNSDSGNEFVPAKFKGIEQFTVDEKTLFDEIVACRRIKTEEELDLMRYVNKISSLAHVEVMKRVQPGMMEYQVEALFRYYVYYHGGCRHCSYTCICGSGENGAILHYGHAAAPNDREIQPNEMLLFDMGGEYHCYASDITRSFPVNGKFSPPQKAIYESVLASQNAVMNAMKPGVSWPDMHRLSLRVICEELKKHGLLQGDVDEMQKHGIGNLFMPHGLGHLMGLDTHDCGGYARGLERSKDPAVKGLRMGGVLEEGMVITVEPGIYFIEFVLDNAFKDPVKSKFLVADKINEFRNFGGVRIEDDIIITKDGIENMTTAPRTVEEIEAVMKEKQPMFI